jgi:hypothetical protein
METSRQATLFGQVPLIEPVRFVVGQSGSSKEKLGWMHLFPHGSIRLLMICTLLSITTNMLHTALV